eukprot:Ihof_evm19s33 gene=Ihof_evmTU19s33
MYGPPRGGPNGLGRQPAPHPFQSTSLPPRPVPAPQLPMQPMQPSLTGPSVPPPQGAPVPAPNYTEYKIIKTHSDRPYHVMRFGIRPPETNVLTNNATLRREDRPDAPIHEPRDQGPLKGVGSVYKDDKKWGKTKRRFERRKEVEMPFQLSLNNGVSYQGTKEGGQTASYVIFVMRANNEMEMIPVTNWYKFTQNINYRTLSLEEAEETMKKQKSIGQRWMMKYKKEDEEEEDTSLPGRPKPRIVAPGPNHDEDLSEDEFKKAKQRKLQAGIRDHEEETPEFEGTFSDDDESAAPKEIIEEESGPAIAMESEESEEDEEGQAGEDDTLTEEGKRLKKLLKDKGHTEDVEEEEQIEADAADESGDEDMVEARAEIGKGLKRPAPEAAGQFKKVKKYVTKPYSDSRKPDGDSSSTSQQDSGAKITEEYLCRLLVSRPFNTKSLLLELNPILRKGSKQEREAKKDIFKSMMLK